MKQFKIRCSAIGQIMGSMAGGITDIQLNKLIALETKRDTEKGNTAKQQEELEMLLEKKDDQQHDPLGKGGAPMFEIE